ncbi:uncharacterized protein [Macaca nemestrina]|uniref:uncharacterized protein isoform X6 n=1 Tax=Macaca nemestrina TaxID=9545 RepID=UPI0039B8FFA5
MTTTDDPRLLFALLIWKNKQTNIKQQQQVEAGIQVTRQRLQFLLKVLPRYIKSVNMADKLCIIRISSFDHREELSSGCCEH